MWRSFFYALSIGLMMLGGEALIFERVTLNPNAKIPPFAQRLLAPNPVGPNFTRPNDNQYAFGGTRQVGGIPNAVGSNAGQFPGILPASTNSGSAYFSQSRFGPSRFAGPASGGYGGGRIGFGQNSQFANAQASRNSIPTQLASSSTPVGTAGFAGRERGPIRQFITKDWMPWSLIAVGAVIFLYTHTSGRRYSD